MTHDPKAGTAVVDIAHALASMHSGTLLECSVAGPDRERLEELAAIIPSLFGARDLAPLERVLARQGGEGVSGSLHEVLFVAAERVHVMKPLVHRRGIALLATSPSTNSVGLVLSTVHRRAAELEGE